jgi:two-component system sensor histidine kinase BarA
MLEFTLQTKAKNQERGMEQFRNGRYSAATELPSRDETAALEAAGGDAGLARELLETLLKGLPHELADLRRCLQGEDWPAVAETAHRMRGATSYCGVPALDTGLQELERAAKSADVARIALGFEHVERQAERLALSLNA